MEKIKIAIFTLTMICIFSASSYASFDDDLSKCENKLREDIYSLQNSLDRLEKRLDKFSNIPENKDSILRPKRKKLLALENEWKERTKSPSPIENIWTYPTEITTIILENAFSDSPTECKSLYAVCREWYEILTSKKTEHENGYIRSNIFSSIYSGTNINIDEEYYKKITDSDIFALINNKKVTSVTVDSNHPHFKISIGYYPSIDFHDFRRTYLSILDACLINKPELKKLTIFGDLSLKELLKYKSGKCDSRLSLVRNNHSNSLKNSLKKGEFPDNSCDICSYITAFKKSIPNIIFRTPQMKAFYSLEEITVGSISSCCPQLSYNFWEHFIANEKILPNMKRYEVNRQPIHKFRTLKKHRLISFERKDNKKWS